MKRLFLLGALALTAVLMAGSAADAQPIRTFVKSTGSDANPCTQAAPCRTLQPAINAVASRGDVIILDSGAFGTGITITKSVNVAAEPGITARIKAAPNGITVSGAEIVVSLRGLHVGGSGNVVGIQYLQGKSLILRDIEVSLTDSTSNTGVYHGASGSVMTLTDSVVRNAGVCVAVNSATLTYSHTTINNTRIVNCETGVNARGHGSMVVNNSVITGSSPSDCFYGAEAVENGVITIDNSTLSFCDYGAFAINSGAFILIGNSLLVGNNYAAVALSGAGGQTTGDNKAFLNGNNNEFSGFTAPTRDPVQP